VIAQLCERFGITGRVRDAALSAHERCAALRYPAQAAAALNVLEAFLAEGIAESDLAGTTGYGYDDAARERYEAVLARVLGAQRALARLSIVSGTHAIVAALAACTPPSKTLLSISGAPYDTLRNAICGDAYSLVSQGVEYEEVALGPDGGMDLAAVELALRGREIATVFVQRSRGYAPRRALSVAECERAYRLVKATSPETLVLVDNCYGELVEEREPLPSGADLIMGSLIKNLGGSIAPGGGYLAGRREVIERVAARLFAPGIGDALGPTLGFGRAFFQGLFLAPSVVEATLRGLDFFAALFEALGYRVDPVCGATRSDIVQAIGLGSAERLCSFAAGLQSALPVNARFKPEPGSVPGYTDRVVMSSGAFVGGATIELSCDAPLRAPYEVYVQGGVSRAHAYLGALFAARALDTAG
jgi:cystathionine beta-lyase family protein involved in aluminum resistance